MLFHKSMLNAQHQEFPVVMAFAGNEMVAIAIRTAGVAAIAVLVQAQSVL